LYIKKKLDEKRTLAIKLLAKNGKPIVKELKRPATV
jgi:hypothetical protein